MGGSAALELPSSECLDHLGRGPIGGRKKIVALSRPDGYWGLSWILAWRERSVSSILGHLDFGAGRPISVYLSGRTGRINHAVPPRHSLVQGRGSTGSRTREKARSSYPRDRPIAVCPFFQIQLRHVKLHVLHAAHVLLWTDAGTCGPVVAPRPMEESGAEGASAAAGEASMSASKTGAQAAPYGQELGGSAQQGAEDVVLILGDLVLHLVVQATNGLGVLDQAKGMRLVRCPARNQKLPPTVQDGDDENLEDDEELVLVMGQGQAEQQLHVSSCCNVTEKIMELMECDLVSATTI